MDTCDWNSPGTDPYGGTVAAAIAAYHLPIATQEALIQAFEARQFDTVVIDRDSIRGKTHDYEPTIREMHFGTRGRICGTVTRDGWSAEHVETAIVVCAGDECFAYPAVCRNVFRISRRARADRPDEQPVVALRDEDPAEVTTPPSDLDVASAVADEDDAAGWVLHPELPSPAEQLAHPPRPFVPLPPLSPVPPAPPVPEPGTWALLAAGLGAIALRKLRR